MIIIRFYKKAALLLTYLGFAAMAVFPQDGKAGEQAADTAESKPVLAIIPVFSADTPVYVPKVVDKLLEAKIEKIGTYSLMDNEKIQGFLDKNGIVLDKEPGVDDLRKYAGEIGADQILMGSVESDGDGFTLQTKIYDVKKGSMILSDSETSSDLRGLDKAVDSLTRRIVQNIFPPEVVTEVEKVLDEEKDTKKEAQVKESIENFADLVEKDPDKALEMFDEPARKALEDKVKEKVVDDEIQNLFEKEKAEKEHQKRLKKERWRLIGMESGIQLGNMFGLIAVNKRIETLLYWDYYMNNTFPIDAYGEYSDNFGPYKGLQSFNYLFSGGLNFWLSRAYNRYLPDTVMLSPLGRTVFKISSILQITGYMGLSLSSQLGFISQHDYLDYMNAGSDFTDKYDSYRTWHTFSRISNYMTIGMWGAGITGITVSLFLPGEKRPLILNDRSRGFLRWSQILVGTGVFTSGVATNFRGKAEESWINDNSSNPPVGDSNYGFYKNTSEVMYYVSYAAYAGGAVLAYLGLSGSSGNVNSEKNKDDKKEDLSFSVLPADGGITAVFGVRY